MNTFEYYLPAAFFMPFLEKNSLPLLLLLTALFAFWKLGQAPLMEWDESRNGVNAIEMLNTGDWLNLHYGGFPDDWSIKPPLAIWFKAASFQCLGKNALALRLPSALASIACMAFIFGIVSLYHSSLFALLTGLILLSVRGFLGEHVGRSGDFEGLLLLCLMAGLYYFLRAIDFKYSRDLYWAALWWGLAFWVKGPAAFVFFPGLALYLLGQGKLLGLLRRPRTWAALFLLLALIGAWVMAIQLWGVDFETNTFAGNNAFERLFLNDLWSRFTNPVQEVTADSSNSFFFFTYLDIRFNLWNYLFYLSLVLIGWSFWKNRKNPQPKDRLLLLSFCLWGTLSLFLTLAATKLHWYMAPVLPFLAITTLYGLRLHWHSLKYLFGLLLILTLARQGYQINTPKAAPAIASIADELLQKNKAVAIIPPLPLQDELLYLHFASTQVHYLQGMDTLQTFDKGTLLFLSEDQYQNRKEQLTDYEMLRRTGKYLFLKALP